MILSLVLNQISGVEFNKKITISSPVTSVTDTHTNVHVLVVDDFVLKDLPVLHLDL